VGSEGPGGGRAAHQAAGLAARVAKAVGDVGLEVVGLPRLEHPALGADGDLDLALQHHPGLLALVLLNIDLAQRQQHAVCAGVALDIELNTEGGRL